MTMDETKKMLSWIEDETCWEPYEFLGLEPSIFPTLPVIIASELTGNFQ
jgi:hypothetical protein